MPFDLVIFDCDGVLVDTEPVANRVFAEAVTELGLPTTTEDCIRDYLGISLPDCYRIIERRLGHAVPESFRQQVRERKYAAYRKGLTAVPGIAEALDRIPLPTCVASSGTHEKMRLTLGMTGLLERFEGRIFSAHDVARGKPHPDLFLHAARTLGAEPSRCAVVEDSPPGVRGGVAAGMTVFGRVALADAETLRRAGATPFKEMSELPGLLSR